MRARLTSFEDNYHSELYRTKRQLYETQQTTRTWRNAALLAWAIATLTLVLVGLGVVKL